jgi:hypothetical protein
MLNICSSRYLLVSLLLLVQTIVFIPTCHSLTLPYPSQVIQWLNQENVSWRQISFPKELTPPQPQQQHTTILELGAPNANATRVVALHLIPTPRSLDESLPSNLNKRMTDLVSASLVHQSCCFPPKIIHLHEDVWITKNEIVCSRLLAQLGRSRRIFARKTTSRRIDATLAMNFLEQHHLWGATRAKYYYGLFLNTKNDDTKNDAELVAVTTFSSRRKILRNNVPFKSHELLRFCAQRDATVVGGISKLNKIFIVEQSPDDIITVVDRDWGDGSGWHSVGFETVVTMAPIAMVVNPNEPGIRRHLVGAGINRNETINPGRMGLAPQVLEELDSIHSANETLQCLSRHGFFPVYDCGVERLMKVVSSEDAVKNISAKELWRLSKPTYASTFYSQNAGIAALLKYAESGMPPLDSEEEHASQASWRATSGTAATARVVLALPSSLDTDATVEVRERPGGWRTVGIVGGATKSIYHAVYKVDTEGRVDARVVVSETLKTMAALALATLTTRKEGEDTERFLHYGYGAGTLPRLLAHHAVDSHHLAVELDTGVVAAAELLLPAQSNIRIQAGDALAYCRTDDAEKPFDCVCIDVFDGSNLVPHEFYSTKFLVRLRDNILAPSGFVVHNFHSGGKKRGLQLEQAAAAYSSVFKTCWWVDSLDSKANAGNAILLGTNLPLENDSSMDNLLSEVALQVQGKYGLRFDSLSRIQGARRILPDTSY